MLMSAGFIKQLLNKIRSHTATVNNTITVKTIEKKQAVRDDITIETVKEEVENSGINRMTAIQTIRNLTFIIAIYAYFAGFIYIYFLYENFGINIRLLNIPIYFYFVYSFNVVMTNIPVMIILFFLILLMTFLSKIGKCKTLLIAFLVLLLPFFFFISKNSADNATDKMRNGYDLKTIKLSFTDENVYEKRFIQMNKQGALKLLLKTTTDYYILLQRKGSALVAELPTGYVHIIPKKALKSVNIFTDKITFKKE